MRKVKYYIDDVEYMKQELNYPDSVIDLLKNRLRAIYTIYGDGNCVNRVEIADYDGNKIDINCLNGFQRGVILSDCYSHFENRKYYNGANKPFGVIRIEEIEV